MTDRHLKEIYFLFDRLNDCLRYYLTIYTSVHVSSYLCRMSKFLIITKECNQYL